MPLKMRVHDREHIGAALRRFKKLLERSGNTKELRKRKFYLKPCEERRRTELRKQSALRKGKALAKNGPRATRTMSTQTLSPRRLALYAEYSHVKKQDMYERI